MIPRRIVQTYRSAYMLSPLAVRCRERMQDLNPGYRCEFFDDRDCREYVVRWFPDLIELYDSFPHGIQRADLFRLLCIWREGGFYFDLDMWLYRPLDSLLRHRLVFPFEWEMSPSIHLHRHREPHEKPEDLRQIGNYAFAAEPGHWFFGEIVEEIVERAELVSGLPLADEHILFSTGPDAVNGALRRFRSRLADDLVILEGPRNPPEPRAGSSVGSGWHLFGDYGNHLLTGGWRMRRRR